MTTPSDSFAGQRAAACAACRHQRRRCSDKCLLAPYFPAHKHNDFKNVHRLFGINNFVKLLNNAPPQRRDDAATSLVYEANCRATNPVGGCYTLIIQLYRQIHLCNLQLRMLSQNLALHKQGLLETGADVEKIFVTEKWKLR